MKRNSSYCWFLLVVFVTAFFTVGLFSCTDDDDDDDTPLTTFIKSYGGSSMETGFWAIQTNDGGYIVSGNTESYGAGATDILVIKTDSLGEVEWEHTYGGTGADNGAAIPRIEGGYAIGGYTLSYGAVGYDGLLCLTDNLGNEEGLNTYGGAGDELFSDGCQTSDSGYILCGRKSSQNGDVWVVKTDSLGNEEWAKTYGGAGYDSGMSIKQTGDGGYIVAAITDTTGTGDRDGWLIKLQSDGNEEWSKTYGGTAGDQFRSVNQIDDGFIVVGFTNSVGHKDVWLLKTDSQGNEQWSKTFGGSERDEGHSVDQTSDSGYIIGGLTKSSGFGDADAYLIKTDTNGNELWSRTFGTSYYEDCTSVMETSDGGFILAGTQTAGPDDSFSDFYIIKTDQNGDVASQ